MKSVYFVLNKQMIDFANVV